MMISIRCSYSTAVGVGVGGVAGTVVGVIPWLLAGLVRQLFKYYFSTSVLRTSEYYVRSHGITPTTVPLLLLLLLQCYPNYSG